MLPLIFSSCAKEEGCTDSLATNYNADAEEDGSCTYTLVGFWDVNSFAVNGSEYIGTAWTEMYIVVNSNLTTETNYMNTYGSTLSVAGTMSISGTTLKITNIGKAKDGNSTTWTITLFDGSNLNANCADFHGHAASMRSTK